MKNVIAKAMGVSLLSACVGTVSAAPAPMEDMSELFSSELSHTQVAPLSQAAMQETKGEFMQLLGFVLAAAAVDLAFTAVTWGSFMDVADKEGAVGEDDVIIQDSAGAEKISGASAPRAPSREVTNNHDDYVRAIDNMKSCDTFCVETHGI